MSIVKDFLFLEKAMSFYLLLEQLDEELKEANGRNDNQGPHFHFLLCPQGMEVIKDENLDRDATYTFVKNAFRDGSVATTGTSITNVLPPVSRFSKTGERTKIRESVLFRLSKFFERFFDISSGAL